MNDTQAESISRLLSAVEAGEAGAFDRLVAAVYPDLKRIAHFQLASERPGHTLSTTAIVHEAFIRLADSDARYSGRRHFLRAAAKVMRHLLVDHARQRNAQKRGDGVRALTLSEGVLPGVNDGLAVLQLESALEGMTEIDPAFEALVECRFFAGLSIKETAEALDSSVRTVERQWQRARAYLLEAMGGGVE